MVREAGPALPTRYHRDPGLLPWFRHLVAESVKVLLDFGHIQVRIRNLTGARANAESLVQPVPSLTKRERSREATLRRHCTANYSGTLKVLFLIAITPNYQNARMERVLQIGRAHV